MSALVRTLLVGGAVVLTGPAYAGAPWLLHERGTLVGVSADGEAYAWRVVGEARGGTVELPAYPCRYPGLPEEPHPQAVTLELCKARGECQAFPIYDLAWDEQKLGADLAEPRCTSEPVAGARLDRAKAAFAAAGVQLGRTGTRLAVARDGMVTVPRSAMQPLGIDADVAVTTTGDRVRPRFVWLGARAQGFPDARVERIDCGSLADTMVSGWLADGSPWLFARIGTAAGSLVKADVPLARIAVRLLTGRAERLVTTDPGRARADVARALALDPSHAPALALRRRLPPD